MKLGPPTVLLVDSDPLEGADLAATLRDAGMEVVATVNTAPATISVARRSRPDIVVVDADVRGMGAPTLVRRLRQQQPDVGIVIRAATASHQALADLVATGAGGFVLAGDAGELVASIRAVAGGLGYVSPRLTKPLLEAVQLGADAERMRARDLERTVARLQALSVTDWLTGLKNHGHFWDRLHEEIERSSRYDRPLAVIMADIDDFKAVNDAHGHGTGDEVLRAIGDVISASVRDSDIACRVGGEEFAVIVPETGTEGALHAAERIRSAVRDLELPAVGRVTLSLGVAVFPYHASDETSLVDASDRALYDAKRSGKDCTRLVGSPARPAGTPVAGMGPLADGLLRALGLRHPDLVDHSVRVSELVHVMARAMRLKVVEMERLRSAALLHDVGMLGVPDALFDKHGPLTPDERAILEGHAYDGHDLIAGTVHEDAAVAVLHHHEHYDGSGYPEGLSGDDIPLLARVLAVAHAFDALRMDRAGHPARTSAEALAEIMSQAGSRYDPEAVEALRVATASRNGAIVLPFPA